MSEIVNEIKSTLVELAGSKKACATLAALVAHGLVKIAGRMGWSWLDAATADQIADRIVALAGAYVIGQGVADHGKEAAVAAASGPTITVATPPVVVAKN